MTETPIPFEQDTTIRKDIRLSKLRRIRDRALRPGEEYVRKGEQVRTVTHKHFDGRQILIVSYERQDVVKEYNPEPPNNWKLKYLIKLGQFKLTQLRNLIRRLLDRTTRLRKRLARPDHGFDEKQVKVLNYQFMVMAQQLEIAVAEAKGRIHDHA